MTYFIRSLAIAAALLLVACISDPTQIDGTPNAEESDVGTNDTSQPDDDANGDGECVPETCETLEVQCGEHDDGCDGTVQCRAECDEGTCSDAGFCECQIPHSDIGHCTDAGAACGEVSVTDTCGEEQFIDCGRCDAPDSCGAFEENQCGCKPRTCDDIDASCGKHPDGCDGWIYCPRQGEEGCREEETCGSNVDGGFECLVECEPNTCGDLECGDIVVGCGQPNENCGECEETGWEDTGETRDRCDGPDLCTEHLQERQTTDCINNMCFIETRTIRYEDSCERCPGSFTNLGLLCQNDSCVF